MTTDSSPLSPAMTSILAPKSRPGVIDFNSIVFPSFTVATCNPADLKMVALTGSVKVVTEVGSAR